MNTHLTKHAQERLHQRSISREIVELLLLHGKREHIGSGLIRCSFLKRNRREIAKEITRHTSMNLDKALSCYLVQCCETGSVVTVAKRFHETRFRRNA